MTVRIGDRIRAVNVRAADRTYYEDRSEGEITQILGGDFLVRFDTGGFNRTVAGSEWLISRKNAHLLPRELPF